MVFDLSKHHFHRHIGRANLGERIVHTAQAVIGRLGFSVEPFVTHTLGGVEVRAAAAVGPADPTTVEVVIHEIVTPFASAAGPATKNV